MVKAERKYICEEQIVGNHQHEQEGGNSIGVEDAEEITTDHCITPANPPYCPQADKELIEAASALAAVAVAAVKEHPNSLEDPGLYYRRRGLQASIYTGRACSRRNWTRGGFVQRAQPTIRKPRPVMMDRYLRDRVSKVTLKPDVGGVSGEEVDIEADQGPEDLSSARRLFDSNVESPSSPLGGYRGVRGSHFSDDGSSSIIDMEEVTYMDPDSIPSMVAEIRRMLDYVTSKPTLQNGSASFMRDYLRTLLAKSSIAAAESIQANKKASKMLQDAGIDGIVECSKPAESFTSLPDELSKHIFSFLDGKNLALARTVCKKWNGFACEDTLWKGLCLRKWKSLETDAALWKLVFNDISRESPTKWRQIYPKVYEKTRWKCRLMKTGRFICHLSAHQLSGAPLGEDGLPPILVVERRFNMLHLRTFVLPESSVLYFEPFDEADKNGFKDFIDYLIKRTRAGLALEEQRRFIFIPPCDYTRSYVGYEGTSLIGVVQNAYPPLAPA